jgi:cell division protein FtsL
VALAEPAYRLNSFAGTAQEATRADGIRAIRTGRASEKSSTPLLVTAAKMAAIVLVVVAVLAFARIALTSATVTTLIESDALSTQIQSARSTGVSLEMEQSVLANSSAIRASAKKLGMAAPGYVGVIELTPDVVAVDANGDLSLSGSVKNVVEARG